MSSATLKKKAINGAIWTIGGYGLSQCLRFGSNLILTRLLVPELFGLMALVQVFIIGLALFSDIGIRPSIIQNKRGDDTTFLNTAWTIQVIRGFGLWIACLIIAGAVAKFYNDSRLLWLIPIVGFNSITHGFTSTSLATFNRHMEVRKLIQFEISMQIVSTSILIVWAWISPTIWALVGGNLVSSLIQMIYSHRINPKAPNRFAWDEDALKELFSFGKWIFVSTAIAFLAGQADKLILGKLFSWELFGVYGIALTLSELPRTVSKAISSKVIFPTLAKFSHLPLKDFRAKLLKNYRPVIIVSACGLAVLVSFGDLLITNLYDDRYVEASWMLPLLGLGIWPGLLTQMTDPALVARGKTQYTALGAFLKFIFMLIGVPLGFHYGKELGAIVAIVLNDVPFYIAIKYGLCREKINSLGITLQEFLATVLLALLVFLMVVGRTVIGLGSPFDGLL